LEQSNWHRQHPTILADEMGLGKTVQICSLIAVLKNKERRMPFLIVVPNSTLGKYVKLLIILRGLFVDDERFSSWSRECAKWIPDVKCVPLPGDSDSCEVVQNWELFKTSGKSKRQLAAPVVLATFQSAEKHANLLREVQRWEVVIVDEGQRLKSGAKGGLFRALSSLRVGHRILMSGTPLNNNLGERTSTQKNVNLRFP
jgi:SNF2 family DNA or RNA helicase